MAFQKGNPGGGRPKGVQNKATRDIRAFLQESVDWGKRRKNLIKLANKGNMKAEELLWQYAFGKPVELQINPVNIPINDGKPIQHEHTHSIEPGTLADLANMAKSFRRPKTNP